MLQTVYHLSMYSRYSVLNNFMVYIMFDCHLPGTKIGYGIVKPVDICYTVIMLNKNPGGQRHVA